eukprot:2775480-Amphidinium_carterae.1
MVSGRNSAAHICTRPSVRLVARADGATPDTKASVANQAAPRHKSTMRTLAFERFAMPAYQLLDKFQTICSTFLDLRQKGHGGASAQSVPREYV